ncbi:unnamed protein product [Arctogadus glacialis]
MLHATMLPPMRKRQRRTEGTESPRYGVEVKFPDVRLYLVEKKMGATRRGFLAQLARAKGFLVEDVLSERVTHVVSEQNQAEELWQWLRRQALNNLPTLHVLDIGWFTDSMREGRPVTLEARHHIQEILPEASTHLPVVVLSRYACQRRTSTENHNEIFTRWLAAWRLVGFGAAGFRNGAGGLSSSLPVRGSVPSPPWQMVSEEDGDWRTPGVLEERNKGESWGLGKMAATRKWEGGGRGGGGGGGEEEARLSDKRPSELSIAGP